MPSIDGGHTRPHPVIFGGIAFIPLTRGKWAVVDVHDIPLVRDRPWQAIPGKRTFYARGVKPGTRTSESMHRVILGLGRGDPGPDHANGNGLDNRRSNLRPATSGQNSANRRSVQGTTSRYKGVYSAKGKWRAKIGARDSRTHLGYFITEEEAARAYDAAAVARWGEYARVNFPLGG